jgi:hypothetical protein
MSEEKEAIIKEGLPDYSIKVRKLPLTTRLVKSPIGYYLDTVARRRAGKTADNNKYLIVVEMDDFIYLIMW